MQMVSSSGGCCCGFLERISPNLVGLSRVSAESQWILRQRIDMSLLFLSAMQILNPHWEILHHLRRVFPIKINETRIVIGFGIHVECHV